MDLTTYLTAVFCLVDDLLPTVLHGTRLRQRGPAPVLHDSEVITCCVVGEFLGLATDRALFRYFRRHHGALFPRLAQVHRTTFTRQAAALGPLLAQCWQHLTQCIQARVPATVDPQLQLVDSMPVPVCRAARAARCRRFAGTDPLAASYSRDPMAHNFFYGFRLHVRVTWPGVVTAAALLPAHVHDVRVAPQLLADAQGWAVGDRAYWSPALRAGLAARGVTLLAPFKHKTATSAAARHAAAVTWAPWLTRLRRRVETVLGQLAERFAFHRVWARDPAHLLARCARKLLGHTLAVWFCVTEGVPSLLAFDQLLTD